MHVLRRIALVAAAVSLWLAPAMADDEEVAPFTLAIVRQDGILTPFATWTGRAWDRSWPSPEKEVDTPITLAEVPKRWWGKPGQTLAWHVWQADGRLTEARATSPAWFPAHCQQGVGLRTSLPVRQPLPPPRVQPYPKAGVAVSRPLDLRTIESVDLTSPMGATVVRSLAAPMNEEETVLVRRYLPDGWRHPYDDQARAQIPIRLEALYRTPADEAGSFTYYFEAVKEYPIRGREGIERTAGPRATPLKPRTCEVVTFASGWFTTRADATAIAPRTFRTRLTSCDYESVDVMLPLAWLTLKGRPVWIAQLSGWGRERYSLLDPESKAQSNEVLFTTPGGYCPMGRD
jgi:hypothetical protein